MKIICEKSRRLDRFLNLILLVYSASSNYIIFIENDNLVNSVREAVNSYGDYYQIKLGLSRPSNEDDKADLFNIDLKNSVLLIAPSFESWLGFMKEITFAGDSRQS